MIYWPRRNREPPSPLALRALPIIIERFGPSYAGFYLECGANNGVSQSNTLLLEKRGWRGMLVEPSPAAFAVCKRERSPRNILVNCALVGDPTITSVEGDFDGHLMSSVGARWRNDGKTTSVAARTLQSVLDEHSIGSIDFFSLDVEGHEREVLAGLDLSRVRPKVFLIEILEENLAAISALLAGHGYGAPANLSGYTRETHPAWRGDHNDYLFVL